MDCNVFVFTSETTGKAVLSIRISTFAKVLGRSRTLSSKVMDFRKGNYRGSSTFGECVLYDHKRLKVDSLLERFGNSSLLSKDPLDLSILRARDQTVYLGLPIGLNSRKQ